MNAQSMNPQSTTLLIIGGGPGGYVAADDKCK